MLLERFVPWWSTVNHSWSIDGYLLNLFFIFSFLVWMLSLVYTYGSEMFRAQLLHEFLILRFVSLNLESQEEKHMKAEAKENAAQDETAVCYSLNTASCQISYLCSKRINISPTSVSNKTSWKVDQGLANQILKCINPWASYSKLMLVLMVAGKELGRRLYHLHVGSSVNSLLL